MYVPKFDRQTDKYFKAYKIPELKLDFILYVYCICILTLHILYLCTTSHSVKQKGKQVRKITPHVHIWSQKLTRQLTSSCRQNFSKAFLLNVQHFLTLYGLHDVRWLIAQMTQYLGLRYYKSNDPSIVAKTIVSELSQPPHYSQKTIILIQFQNV